MSPRPYFILDESDMESTHETASASDSTSDAADNHLGPNMAPTAPDVEPAHGISTFACVHPTITLRAATEKINGAAPIIDVQTDIVVRYADGNVSRVSVAHSQHEAGNNAARISDALSKLTADCVVRCLAN